MAKFDLHNVKVGDQVVISNRSNGLSVANVERVTKTQFVAGGRRYTKCGREVGADTWSSSYARKPTPELLNRAQSEQRYDKALNTLRRLENMIETQRIAINHQHNRYQHTEQIEAALEHMRAAVNCLCLDQEEQ